MVLELLKKEAMNVIVVDWRLGSSVLNLYDVAAGNTRLVGVQVAHLIDVLNRKFQVPLKKFHIIGHSLGAQVAGFAGEKLRKGGKVIGRITGITMAQFSIKCHKIKTKVINLTNHNRCKQRNEPIRIESKLHATGVKRGKTHARTEAG